MRRAYVVLHRFKGLRNIGHHMRVSNVEADSNIIQVRGLNELNQSLWRSQFVRNVFEQNAHAERLGKCTKMLDRRHRRFEFVLVEELTANPEVLHQKTIGNMLSD